MFASTDDIARTGWSFNAELGGDVDTDIAPLKDIAGFLIMLYSVANIMKDSQAQ